MDRTCGIHTTQLPLQVPQSIQGVYSVAVAYNLHSSIIISLFAFSFEYNGVIKVCEQVFW